MHIYATGTRSILGDGATGNVFSFLFTLILQAATFVLPKCGSRDERTVSEAQSLSCAFADLQASTGVQRKIFFALLLVLQGWIPRGLRSKRAIAAY